jgi:hypothetical protein
MIFQIIFFAVWLIRSPFAITANVPQKHAGRDLTDELPARVAFQIY